MSSVAGFSDRRDSSAEALLAGQNRILEMIASNAPIEETLTSLVLLIESQFEGMICSVVLLDEDGQHIHHGAAPNLPDPFLKAIDGILIGPKVGSCGTAIFRGEPVVVSDILEDPLWEDYRTLAMRHGLRACWSTPIASHQGRILGSFAMYYREPRSPGSAEIELINVGTHIAGIAIESWQGDLERRREPENYRTIVENLNDVVFSIDGEGRFSYASPIVEEVSGYAVHEVIGKPFSLFVHPEDLASLQKSLADTAAAIEAPFEFRAFKKSGGILWCRTSSRRVLAGDRVVGFTGILQDITERKQAEAAVRDSEQRLSGIIASAMDAIISVDGEQRILLFNAAAEKMFRCSAVEAMGQPLDRFIPERFRSAHRAHMQRFGDTGVTERFMGAEKSLRALRADGEEFEIEASVSQIESSGKKVYTVIVRDITERKWAEEALLKSEERFSKAFRSSPLAITISTEAEGQYLDVNEAFLQMLGYTRREVIGRTAQELSFWAEPSHREEVLRQLKKHGRVTGFQTQYATAKGTIRDAEVAAELVELDGQRCMLAITRDVTETRQLEVQFRQAQKMEAVGRLAAGVAHDFNNLLGVIIGCSDLALPLIPSGSRLNRYLEEIKKASNRAIALTRQLLAFSRQQAVFPKVLNLNEVVHNATSMLQRIAGEDVVISFLPILPIDSIHADPGQIEQVLMNLVVNARDAMPRGGKIVIETAHAELDEHFVSQHPGSRAGHHVVLAVGDTGCGMDENIRSKIFEPFFTTKGIGRGTGLGLSTVYGIVKQSGGYISVRSEPGQGSEFKIYFPGVAAEAEHLAEPHEETEFPGGSETILVVEDDESLRDVALHMLQDAGYRVIGASHAKAALAFVEAANPRIDLLLTDVIMQGDSGVELLEQAKAVDPNLRSLFMSGYTGDLHQRGGLRPEAVLLDKPFTRSSLLRKVRSVLQVEPTKQRPQEGHEAAPELH